MARPDDTSETLKNFNSDDSQENILVTKATAHLKALADRCNKKKNAASAPSIQEYAKALSASMKSLEQYLAEVLQSGSSKAAVSAGAKSLIDQWLQLPSALTKNDVCSTLKYQENQMKMALHKARRVLRVIVSPTEGNAYDDERKTWIGKFRSKQPPAFTEDDELRVNKTVEEFEQMISLNDKTDWVVAFFDQRLDTGYAAELILGLFLYTVDLKICDCSSLEECEAKQKEEKRVAKEESAKTGKEVKAKKHQEKQAASEDKAAHGWRGEPWAITNWGLRVGNDPKTAPDVAARCEKTLTTFQFLRDVWDEGLYFLPSTRTVVFRGLNVKVSNNFRMNTNVVFPAFTSTSLVGTEAQNFMDRGNSGTFFIARVHTAAMVQQFSWFPEQAEALLKSFSTFAVKFKMSRTVLQMLNCRYDVITMIETGDEAATPSDLVHSLYHVSQHTSFIYKSHLDRYVTSRLDVLPPPRPANSGTPVFAPLQGGDLFDKQLDSDNGEYITESWLRDETKKHMVVLGSAGTGKTSTALAALSRLGAAKRKLNEKVIYTVFVPLPSVQGLLDAKNALDAHVMEQLGLRNDADMECLVSSSIVVLLIDSLDEVRSNGVKPQGILDMNPWCSRMRCILTCRPEFMTLNDIFPSSSVLTSDAGAVSTYHVLPFEASDVDSLITRYVASEIGGNEDSQTQMVAKISRELQEMNLDYETSHTPITLNIAISVVVSGGLEIMKEESQLLHEQEQEEARREREETEKQPTSGQQGALQEEETSSSPLGEQILSSNKSVARYQLYNAYLYSFTDGINGPRPMKSKQELEAHQKDRRSMGNLLRKGLWEISLLMLDRDRWNCSIRECVALLERAGVADDCRRKWLENHCPCRMEDAYDDNSTFEWGHKSIGEYLCADAFWKHGRDYLVATNRYFSKSAPQVLTFFSNMARHQYLTRLPRVAERDLIPIVQGGRKEDDMRHSVTACFIPVAIDPGPVTTVLNFIRKKLQVVHTDKDKKQAPSYTLEPQSNGSMMLRKVNNAGEFEDGAVKQEWKEYVEGLSETERDQAKNLKSYSNASGRIYFFAFFKLTHESGYYLNFMSQELNITLQVQAQNDFNPFVTCKNMAKVASLKTFENVGIAKIASQEGLAEFDTLWYSEEEKKNVKVLVGKVVPFLTSPEGAEVFGEEEKKNAKVKYLTGKETTKTFPDDLVPTFVKEYIRKAREYQLTSTFGKIDTSKKQLEASDSSPVSFTSISLRSGSTEIPVGTHYVNPTGQYRLIPSRMTVSTYFDKKFSPSKNCHYASSNAFALLGSTKTPLFDVDFSKLNIVEANLNACRLDGVNFSKTTFEHCSLLNTSFRQTDMRGAYFRNCQFFIQQRQLKHSGELACVHIPNKSHSILSCGADQCASITSVTKKHTTTYMCHQSPVTSIVGWGLDKEEEEEEEVEGDPLFDTDYRRRKEREPNPSFNDEADSNFFVATGSKRGTVRIFRRNSAKKKADLLSKHELKKVLPKEKVEELQRWNARYRSIEAERTSLNTTPTAEQNAEHLLMEPDLVAMARLGAPTNENEEHRGVKAMVYVAATGMLCVVIEGATTIQCFSADTYTPLSEEERDAISQKHRAAIEEAGDDMDIGEKFCKAKSFYSYRKMSTPNMSLDAHEAPVSALSTNGNILFSGDTSGTSIVWTFHNSKTVAEESEVSHNSWLSSWTVEKQTLSTLQGKVAIDRTALSDSMLAVSAGTTVHLWNYRYQRWAENESENSKIDNYRSMFTVWAKASAIETEFARKVTLKSSVHSLSLTENSELMVGSADNQSFIFNLMSGEVVKQGAGSRQTLALAPNGTSVLAAQDDNSVVKIDLNGLQKSTGHNLGVTSVCNVPGGGLMTASKDFTISIWDSSFQHVQTFALPETPTKSIIWNDAIVAGSSSGNVWMVVDFRKKTFAAPEKLHSISDGASIDQLTPINNDFLLCIAHSHLVVLDNEFSVSKERKLKFPVLGSVVLTNEETGEQYILLTQDREIAAFDTKTLDPLQKFPFSTVTSLKRDPDNALTCLQLSYHKNYLIAGDDGGTLFRWDPKQEDIRAFRAAHQSMISCVECTKDNLMYAGSVDQLVSVWDLKSVTFLRHITFHSAPINNMSLYDRDPNKVCIASEDAMVTVCDARIKKGSTVITNPIKAVIGLVTFDTTKCRTYSKFGKGGKYEGFEMDEDEGGERGLTYGSGADEDVARAFAAKTVNTTEGFVVPRKGDAVGVNFDGFHFMHESSYFPRVLMNIIINSATVSRFHPLTVGELVFEITEPGFRDYRRYQQNLEGPYSVRSKKNDLVVELESTDGLQRKLASSTKLLSVFGGEDPVCGPGQMIRPRLGTYVIFPHFARGEKTIAVNRRIAKTLSANETVPPLLKALVSTDEMERSNMISQLNSSSPPTNFTNFDKYLAIKYAVTSNKMDAFDAIMAAYPETLLMTDICGRNPMHFATMWNRTKMLEKMELMVPYNHRADTLAASDVTGLTIPSTSKKTERIREVMHMKAGVAKEFYFDALADQFWFFISLPGVPEFTDKEICNEVGSHPAVTDTRGITPLHIAAASGKLELVKKLVGLDRFDVSAKDNSGRTPMLVAAAGKHLDIVEYFATLSPESLADPDGADVTPIAYLCCAALKPHFRRVEALFDIAEKFFKEIPVADSETKLLPRLISIQRMCVKNKFPAYILNKCLWFWRNERAPGIEKHREIATKRAESLKQAKPTDYEIFHKFWEIKAPQDEVWYFNEPGIRDMEVEDIIKSVQAAPFDSDSLNFTPYHIAARWGRMDVIKGLEEAIPGRFDMADVDFRDRTPILMAAENGHLDLVEYFAENAPDTLALPDTRGNTPIAALLMRHREFTSEKDAARIEKLFFASQPLLYKNMRTETGRIALQVLFNYMTRFNLSDLFYCKLYWGQKSWSTEIFERIISRHNGRKSRTGQDACPEFGYTQDTDEVWFFDHLNEKSSPRILQDIETLLEEVPFTTDSRRVSALQIAAKNVTLLKKLIDSPKYATMISHADQRGRTVLSTCAALGRWDFVQKLSDSHPDLLVAPDNLSDTPIAIGCRALAKKHLPDVLPEATEKIIVALLKKSLPLLKQKIDEHERYAKAAKVIAIELLVSAQTELFDEFAAVVPKDSLGSFSLMPQEAAANFPVPYIADDANAGIVLRQSIFARSNKQVTAVSSRFPNCVTEKHLRTALVELLNDDAVAALVKGVPWDTLREALSKIFWGDEVTALGRLMELEGYDVEERIMTETSDAGNGHILEQIPIRSVEMMNVVLRKGMSKWPKVIDSKSILAQVKEFRPSKVEILDAVIPNLAPEDQQELVRDFQETRSGTQLREIVRTGSTLLAETIATSSELTNPALLSMCATGAANRTGDDTLKVFTPIWEKLEAEDDVQWRMKAAKHLRVQKIACKPEFAASIRDMIKSYVEKIEEEIRERKKSERPPTELELISAGRILEVESIPEDLKELVRWVTGVEYEEHLPKQPHQDEDEEDYDDYEDGADYIQEMMIGFLENHIHSPLMETNERQRLLELILDENKTSWRKRQSRCWGEFCNKLRNRFDRCNNAVIEEAREMGLVSLKVQQFISRTPELCQQVSNKAALTIIFTDPDCYKTALRTWAFENIQTSAFLEMESLKNPDLDLVRRAIELEVLPVDDPKRLKLYLELLLVSSRDFSVVELFLTKYRHHLINYLPTKEELRDTAAKNKEKFLINDDEDDYEDDEDREDDTAQGYVGEEGEIETILRQFITLGPLPMQAPSTLMMVDLIVVDDKDNARCPHTVKVRLLEDFSSGVQSMYFHCTPAQFEGVKKCQFFSRRAQEIIANNRDFLNALLMRTTAVAFPINFPMPKSSGRFGGNKSHTASLKPAFVLQALFTDPQAYNTALKTFINDFNLSHNEKTDEWTLKCFDLNLVREAIDRDFLPNPDTHAAQFGAYQAAILFRCNDQSLVHYFVETYRSTMLDIFSLIVTPSFTKQLEEDMEEAGRPKGKGENYDTDDDYYSDDDDASPEDILQQFVSSLKFVCPLRLFSRGLGSLLFELMLASKPTQSDSKISSLLRRQVKDELMSSFIKTTAEYIDQFIPEDWNVCGLPRKIPDIVTPAAQQFIASDAHNMTSWLNTRLTIRKMRGSSMHSSTFTGAVKPSGCQPELALAFITEADSRKKLLSQYFNKENFYRRPSDSAEKSSKGSLKYPSNALFLEAMEHPDAKEILGLEDSDEQYVHCLAEYFIGMNNDRKLSVKFFELFGSLSVVERVVVEYCRAHPLLLPRSEDWGAKLAPVLFKIALGAAEFPVDGKRKMTISLINSIVLRGISGSEEEVEQVFPQSMRRQLFDQDDLRTGILRAIFNTAVAFEYHAEKEEKVDKEDGNEEEDEEDDEEPVFEKIEMHYVQAPYGEILRLFAFDKEILAFCADAWAEFALFAGIGVEYTGDAKKCALAALTSILTGDDAGKDASVNFTEQFCGGIEVIQTFIDRFDKSIGAFNPSLNFQPSFTSLLMHHSQTPPHQATEEAEGLAKPAQILDSSKVLNSLFANTTAKFQMAILLSLPAVEYLYPPQWYWKNVCSAAEWEQVGTALLEQNAKEVNKHLESAAENYRLQPATLSLGSVTQSLNMTSFTTFVQMIHSFSNCVGGNVALRMKIEQLKLSKIVFQYEPNPVYRSLELTDCSEDATTAEISVPMPLSASETVEVGTKVMIRFNNGWSKGKVIEILENPQTGEKGVVCCYNDFPDSRVFFRKDPITGKRTPINTSDNMLFDDKFPAPLNRALIRPLFSYKPDHIILMPHEVSAYEEKCKKYTESMTTAKAEWKSQLQLHNELKQTILSKWKEEQTLFVPFNEHGPLFSLEEDSRFVQDLLATK